MIKTKETGETEIMKMALMSNLSHIQGIVNYIWNYTYENIEKASYNFF